MRPATAGDPITGLKWTRTTTAKVSEELRKLDIEVGPRTVARLLDDLHYRLRVNHKKLSRGSTRTRRERNQQFLYLEKMRRSFVNKGLPVISVDTNYDPTRIMDTLSGAGYAEARADGRAAADLIPHVYT